MCARAHMCLCAFVPASRFTCLSVCVCWCAGCFFRRGRRRNQELAPNRCLTYLGAFFAERARRCAFKPAFRKSTPQTPNPWAFLGFLADAPQATMKLQRCSTQRFANCRPSRNGSYYRRHRAPVGVGGMVSWHNAAGVVAGEPLPRTSWEGIACLGGDAQAYHACLRVSEFGCGGSPTGGFKCVAGTALGE